MKKLLGAAVAAAAVALNVAPAASADSFSYTKTMVQWDGAPCIEVDMAAYGYQTLCGFNGMWESNENVYVGQDFGMDPIMGGADWISCQVYVDTVLAYTDYASAGDGHDVNCWRQLLGQPSQYTPPQLKYAL